MMKNSNWGESSIHAHTKKAHNAPIISISIKDKNLFYTSSEDNTLRLWDLRLHSTVKLFKSQGLKNLTNCQNDKENQLLVGSGQNVYAFDTRKEGVFIEQVSKKSEQAHFDDISCIKLDKNQGMLGVGDDEGDIRMYNSDLECTGLLDQGHSNIINAIEYVNTEQGLFCISGGYDCKLIHWRVEEQKIVRQFDLQQLLKKYEIKATTLPFVHSIYLHKTTLYVTTESGHVLSYAVKDLKKPKYILQASLSRVVQSRIPDFNENLLITLAKDGSFSFFDHTKRLNGTPLFLQKYKCHDQPNWIEILNNEIIISNSLSSELSFFTVK